MNSFIENIVFFEQPHLALEHKTKAEHLVANLEVLQAPDNYDYYGKEAHLQTIRYYGNQPFIENQGPYNDLGHFSATAATLIRNLFKSEIGSGDQLERYTEHYNECIDYLQENLRDMQIFYAMVKHLSRYPLYKEDIALNTYIQDGVSFVNKFKSLAERANALGL